MMGSEWGSTDRDGETQSRLLGSSTLLRLGEALRSRWVLHSTLPSRLYALVGQIRSKPDGRRHADDEAMLGHRLRSQPPSTLKMFSRPSHRAK
jgi:hypothetical protein